MSFGEQSHGPQSEASQACQLSPHRALESILLSVLSALESEMYYIRRLIGGLLAELEDDIDRDKFKTLLHYSRKLSGFQSRAKLVRGAARESADSVAYQESRFKHRLTKFWSRVSTLGALSAHY